MKKLVLCASLCLSLIGQSNAQASPGVRLLGQLPLTSFEGLPSIGSAIIGYTSPAGREYAIIGLSNGKHFVDITDPMNPTIVGFVATPNSSAWQEMCVKNGYCYGVSEHNKLAIIDIRDIDNGNVRFVGEWSTTITGEDGITQYTYGRSHTVQASKINDVIFLNGSSGFDRRYFIALNVSNPEVPYIQSYVRHYDPALNIGGDVLYVHDCTIVNYDSGPYAGKEIAFLACGPDGLWTADVTDPSNIVLLGQNQYLPSGTYCHSGSLDPSGRYFYANDEFDEAQGTVTSNTTHMFNVEDLSAPNYIGPTAFGHQFVDHNSVLEGKYLMVSSYRGGLRVIKWIPQQSSTAPPVLSEVGYYDTYPGPDATDYEGNWGVAGGFVSGNVILSDRQSGLFIVDPTELTGYGVPVLAQLIPQNQIVSGSIYNIRKADNKYVILQGNQIDFTFESTMPLLPYLDIRYELASVGPDPIEYQFWIKNQTSGQWELKDRGRVWRNDQIMTVPNLDPATYINATTKRIETRFKMWSGRPTFPTAVRIKMDRFTAIQRDPLAGPSNPGTGPQF